MKLKTRDYFDDFITESFNDGIYHRELRLSSNEKEIVRKKYPKAIIKESSLNQSNVGKKWYDVTIHPVI